MVTSEFVVSEYHALKQLRVLAALNGYRPRVLVAEDDPEMRRLLVETFQRDGYDVREAGSGLALFDELRSARKNGEPPALIVSDIRMPGQSGLDVLRSIRAWGWTVPVLLITGFGDEDTQLEATESGATCIFSKPFDMDDLRLAVMHFLPRAIRREPSHDHDGYAEVRRR